MSMPATELVRLKKRQTTNSLCADKRLNSDAKSCLSASKSLLLSVESHLTLRLPWISVFYSICRSKDENIRSMSANYLHLNSGKLCQYSSLPLFDDMVGMKTNRLINGHQHSSVKSYRRRRWEQLSSARKIYGRRARV